MSYNKNILKKGAFMKFSKVFNLTKSKNFWLYIVLGSLLILSSIILMPIWININKNLFFASWGTDIIKLVIAVILVLYLSLYLFRKLFKKENKAIKILVILEFVILSIIALSCILAQFNVFKVNDAGKILGIVLYLRGSIEIFRAYYYDRSSSDKYSIWWLIASLLLVSAGVVFIIGGYLTNLQVLWVLVISLLILGVVFIVLGFIKKPNKK